MSTTTTRIRATPRDKSNAAIAFNGPADFIIDFLSSPGGLERFSFLHVGRHPGAVEYGGLGPIATKVEGEGAAGCGQPVGFLVFAGRVRPDVECEGTVRVVLQGFV